MVYLGLHTFYMRRTPIVIDITRDNHGATIRKLQPDQSIFSATLTGRPENAKINLSMLLLCNSYTI